MVKIKRTIEVEVCERCNEDLWGTRITCCICQRELCPKCDTGLTVVVERSIGILDYSLRHSGLTATFCKEDAEQAKKVLRDAGFKDFSFDINPV